MAPNSMSLPSLRRVMDGAPRPSMASRRSCAFDVDSFLNSAGFRRRVMEFQRNDIIYAQGDPSNDVLFIREGSVKRTVVNTAGKEAIVEILGSGDFMGETCLADQPVRRSTATALVPTSVLVIDKHEMTRVLHGQPEFSDRFLAYLLARRIRIEEDLVNQFLNDGEKRLARALLLLARYGQQDQPQRALPVISQELLAEMVGTTRSRVNFFMNKFKKQGFIKYGSGLRGLQIDGSLLSFVQRD